MTPADPQIDHPPHYGGADDPYETIKVLEAWLTPEEFAGFLKGSAIKYLSRATREGALVEDYAKARGYAERLTTFVHERGLGSELLLFLMPRGARAPSSLDPAAAGSSAAGAGAGSNAPPSLDPAAAGSSAAVDGTGSNAPSPHDPVAEGSRAAVGGVGPELAAP